MSESIDATSAAARVPQVWSQGLIDALKDDCFILKQFERFRGRECQWHEAWTGVLTPDDEWFKAGEATVNLVALDPAPVFELRASKVVTRSVPDVAAQSDLETLLNKWRSEGKGELAESLESLGYQDYYDSASEILTTEVTEAVERVAAVEDCKFYMAEPRGGTISIPKLDGLVFDVVKGMEPDE